MCDKHIIEIDDESTYFNGLLNKNVAAAYFYIVHTL